MESYQNYSDYQNAYSAHFDTLFRVYEVMKESVDDIDTYQAKMCAQESANDIMDKIKAFFKTLIEKIKQFIKDIKTAVKNKFQQIQLQRKLTEIKKILVENRNSKEIAHKKIRVFDAMKYNAAYNKYIAMISKEITSLSTTKFNSLNELNNEIDKIHEHITSYAEKLNLTSSEKYQIEVGVMEAMKVAEQSITIYDKEYSVTGDVWVKSITNAEKVCTTNNTIVVDKFATLTQKFSNKCSELFNLMAKHPVKSVAIILGAVTAISVVSHGIASKKEFNRLDAEDKRSINDIEDNIDEARQRINDTYEYNKKLFKLLEKSRKVNVESEFEFKRAAEMYGRAIERYANHQSIDEDELDKQIASTFMTREGY